MLSILNFMNEELDEDGLVYKGIQKYKKFWSPFLKPEPEPGPGEKEGIFKKGIRKHKEHYYPYMKPDLDPEPVVPESESKKTFGEFIKNPPKTLRAGVGAGVGAGIVTAIKKNKVNKKNKKTVTIVTVLSLPPVAYSATS